MSFIDEAAREINVKLVWYSAWPQSAAAAVRHVARRTIVDSSRVQVLDVHDGSVITHHQFVPAPGATLRGFSTRFHQYAIEQPTGAAIEGDDNRQLLFRGADACIFLGGPGEAEALGRVDAVFAALGYANVPAAFGLEGASAAEAVMRGRALGFPDADAFAIDPTNGAGIIEVFKAIAKKLMGALAGHAPPPGRPMPLPGTQPQQCAPREPVAPTLEKAHEGLDAWQRAYHEKAVWILGLEVARTTPSDLPPGYPAHCIHVVRPTASDGFALMSNGFSREPYERVELRADTAKDGWQIATALSFLGRIRHRRLTDGGPPWRPYDLVTSEAPVFGLEHFVLFPGGSVRVNDEAVTILRVAPISPAEHAEVRGKIVGDALAAWLAERRSSMLERWLPALAHDRAFAD